LPKGAGFIPSPVKKTYCPIIFPLILVWPNNIIHNKLKNGKFNNEERLGMLSFLFFSAFPPKGNVLRSNCALKANGKVITCGRCRKRNYQASILFRRK
jgi:hypothetical protein